MYYVGLPKSGNPTYAAFFSKQSFEALKKLSATFRIVCG
jgi:hypothetical protein